VGAVFLLWWLVGALQAYEEHLDIIVGFGLKTDYHYRFPEPAQKATFIVGF